MDNYTSFIRKIKPFPESKYEGVSSREKLVAYAIYYLENNGIPSYFNYVCVAAFKMFPKRFHLGDFEEYPHIEMLNRTILHLRPKENNYAEGRVSTGYELTDLGYKVAKETEKILLGKKVAKQKGKAVKIDQKKKTVGILLTDIKNNEIFKKWKKDKEIDDNDLWVYFNVTPYSRIKFLQDTLKENKLIAKKEKNTEVTKFLTYMEKKLNSII